MANKEKSGGVLECGEEGGGDDGRNAVIHYLADMTGQLETVARSAKLELLAYLLAMARIEAEVAKFEGRKKARNRSGARKRDTDLTRIMHRGLADVA